MGLPFRDQGHLVRTSHILVLVGFSLAQPLYSLLSQYPEFFLAHHCETIDLLILTVVLSLVVPAIIAVVEVVVEKMIPGEMFPGLARGLVTGGLFALIVMAPLLQRFRWPASAYFFVARFIGLAFASAYLRFHSLRMFLTVLSPSFLLFPVLFLFQIDLINTSRLPESQIADYRAPAAGLHTTILFLVLDELPLISLLDSEYQIDPVRYPNFSRLANTATWYPRARTISGSTANSVVSILTSRFPDRSKLPTLSDHPANLFTLLSGTHSLRVFESVTRLCPQGNFENSSAHSPFHRFPVLFADVAIVYLHMVIPPTLRSHWPTINRTWRGFLPETLGQPNQTPDGKSGWTPRLRKAYTRLSRDSYANRPSLFERFVGGIARGNGPGLYFIHTFLPHPPWEYLPNGRRYTTSGWRILGLDWKTKSWTADEWAVTQAYQRHLLQVGLVDTLLGKLIARIEGEELFEESLIVVTADHGARFRPLLKRRQTEEKLENDLLAVPLLIKKPGQTDGVIDTSAITTLDILPIVLNLLGVEPTWEMQGKTPQGGPAGPEWPTEQWVHEPSLRFKLTHFGSGTSTRTLFPIGSNSQLIGHPLTQFTIVDEPSVHLELENRELYDQVHLGGSFLPALVTGHVKARSVEDAVQPHLAIAVNRTIRAVTRTIKGDGRTQMFEALVPEDSFREGPNTVEVFIIRDLDGRTELGRPWKD